MYKLVKCEITPVKEWMNLSDLNIPFKNSEETSELTHNWQRDRAKYSDQQISEMPLWIKTSKKVTQFKNTMKLWMKAVLVRCKNWLMTLSLIFSTDLLRLKESLCLIVFRVAGTGKSYLINAIRNLLQGKCTVTATTGKADYNNISDSAFFFNCLLGLEVKKILEVRACAGCRKI